MKKGALLAVFFFGILLCFSLVHAQSAPLCTPQLKIYNTLSDFQLLNGVQNAGPIPTIAGSESNQTLLQTVTIGNLTLRVVPPRALGLAAGSKASPTTNLIPTGDSVIAVHGVEDVNITFSSQMYSFGFEMYEPSNPVYCFTNYNFCFNTTFQVRLLKDAQLVGTFLFNVPDDTRSFVGVLSNQSFNQIEIRDYARTSDVYPLAYYYNLGTIDNEYFLSFYYSNTSSFIPLSSCTQCNDSIDNDGDGLMDGLVELNMTQTKKFSDKAPWGVYDNMEVFMRSHGQKSPQDLLGRQRGGMALVNDILTATKFCNIMGYRTSLSVNPYDSTGRTIWTNGGDTVYNWDGTRWIRTDNLASYRNPNNIQWIADITCKDRLPVCSDGIDNDKDGYIDYPADVGCASLIDDSEIGHDPDCTSLDDPTESPQPQCSDRIDNADPEDTLIDCADPGCWTTPGNQSSCNPNDDNETDLPQCSDRIDNADPEDTLIDCADPGCWTTPGNSSSCNPLDNDETNVGSVSSAYWTNMLGTPITIADLKDSVKLVVTGVGFATKEITYKIYKKQGSGFLDWFFPDKFIAQSSTQGFLVWKAGQKQSDGMFTGCNGPDCYYFTASVAGVGQVTSGNLEVRTEENNKPPQVKIINPKDKGIYFKDALISFTAEVSDEDDALVSYSWNLGEVSVTPRSGTLDLKPTGMATITFNYTYLTSGQKNTILVVIDERNAMNKDQASILVVDSINPAKYIFAYIDIPKFGESFGRTVQFDAHSTYSVDITFPTLNTFVIDCVAGFCPGATTGCPPGQASCSIAIRNYPTCYGLGTNACNSTEVRANYDPITFEWIFDGDVSTTYQGIGSSYTYFTHDFIQSGSHIVRLKTKINPESSTQTEFITNFPGTSCVLIEDSTLQFTFSTFIGKNLQIRKDSVWINSDASGNAQFSVATNDCYRVNGYRIISETGRPILDPVCCASLNPICDSSHRCIPISYRYCKDVLTQVECNGTSSVLAKNQIEEETSINLGVRNSFGNNNLCTVGFDYGCVWGTNPTTSTMECLANYQANIVYQSTTSGKVWNFDLYNTNPTTRGEIKSYCNANDNDIDDQEVSCTLIEDNVIGDCSRGSSYTVSYHFQQIGAITCPPPSTKTVKCPNIPRLTFFTFVNLLAVILLLIIVYYLHQRIRTRKKSRKPTKK